MHHTLYILFFQLRDVTMLFEWARHVLVKEGVDTREKGKGVALQYLAVFSLNIGVV